MYLYSIYSKVLDTTRVHYPYVRIKIYYNIKHVQYSIYEYVIGMHSGAVEILIKCIELHLI